MELLFDYSLLTPLTSTFDLGHAWVITHHCFTIKLYRSMSQPQCWVEKSPFVKEIILDAYLGQASKHYLHYWWLSFNWTIRAKPYKWRLSKHEHILQIRWLENIVRKTSAKHDGTLDHSTWAILLHIRTEDVQVNTLRPKQNDHLSADDIFECIFFNENVCFSIKISLKFVPKGLINNIPALVQIMAWRQLGDKPLSEPMMVR